MLHIVGHQVRDGNVSRVGEAGALLDSRVEVGVCAADDVLPIRG